jgi:antitoxin VapB
MSFPLFTLGVPGNTVEPIHECRRPFACLEKVVYHMVDTKEQRRSIMAIAKVFRTGRSQAIRLPKEFRVDADTVHLKRTAEGFLVITKEPWEIFFEGVELLSDKFLGWERVQPGLESRD